MSGPGVALGAPAQDFHTVRRGENLTGIGRRFHITPQQLMDWNELDDDRIVPGQELRLSPPAGEETVHVVRSGETLSLIARRYGMTVGRLKLINDLTDDRILVGQQLRLRDVDLTAHLVERGDALWEIARAYGMTVDELKKLNHLRGSRIYPGQELRVRPAEGPEPVEPDAPGTAEYLVRSGDNLTDIARLHQMSLRELRQMNGLSGSLIHPGRTLRVRPLLGGGRSNTTAGEMDWTSLQLATAVIPRIEATNGPYYWHQPRAIAQQGQGYFEDTNLSPLRSYERGRQLWKAFAAKVDRMERRSDRLAGWHFVLDPGHGGIDPGAIVPARDSAGKRIYVVEDEYVYDLALRVYVLLRLHGAEATPTLLSPNHLVRGNEPANRTFVHDRNETFNLYSWNRRNRPSSWPKGGQECLNKRIEVARWALKGIPRGRQVFLSFHADNDPHAGDAVTLFHFQNRSRTDTPSRDFARDLLPAMGAGARVKGRNFGVLRSNPVRLKLLLEMRNMAHPDQVWALRREELRQRDAEKVVRALLDSIGAPGDGTS